jgi:hypothetical protein
MTAMLFQGILSLWLLFFSTYNFFFNFFSMRCWYYFFIIVTNFFPVSVTYSSPHYSPQTSAMGADGSGPTNNTAAHENVAR